MKFSIIIPTRHRPKFVAESLKFLKQQKYRDIEIIISDNYIDPTLSCEAACKASTLAGLKYVRPPEPLGMVENWNYALQFASGDYVLYLTDKMFLLPSTLDRVAAILKSKPVDIVTWVDDMYQPDSNSSYFGPGLYMARPSSVKGSDIYVGFDPQVELNKKTECNVARHAQNPSEYARGKICFGCYSRGLIARIIDKAGKLFHNVSPDYTSMILALSYASSAIEIKNAGIVHVSTDISNGGQASIRDSVAMNFLKTLDSYEDIFKNLLVPELFVCTHNVVAHDYLVLKQRLNLNFNVNRINWLVHIISDLNIKERVWSSPSVKAEQFAILNQYISESLSSAKRDLLRQKLSELSSKPLRGATQFIAKIKPYVPQFILNSRQRLLGRRFIRLNSITDILKAKL